MPTERPHEEDLKSLARPPGRSFICQPELTCQPHKVSDTEAASEAASQAPAHTAAKSEDELSPQCVLPKSRIREKKINDCSCF